MLNLGFAKEAIEIVKSPCGAKVAFRKGSCACGASFCNKLVEVCTESAHPNQFVTKGRLACEPNFCLWKI